MDLTKWADYDQGQYSPHEYVSFGRFGATPGSLNKHAMMVDVAAQQTMPKKDPF